LRKNPISLLLQVHLLGPVLQVHLLGPVLQIHVLGPVLRVQSLLNQVQRWIFLMTMKITIIVQKGIIKHSTFLFMFLYIFAAS